MVGGAREGTALFAFALGLRALAAWSFGGGAPFGPDGTGAEAAVTLGGHLYPSHIQAIGLVGSARTLSVIAGAVGCLLLWTVGRRTGLGGIGGWLAATLPVGVYTGALSAGDAPALMVVLAGVTLATAGRGWAIVGGALAMACVTVKPIALPALSLLAIQPLSLIGALVALPLMWPWLGALTDPMPQGGVLGTWWLASAGALPTDWVAWGITGLKTAVDTPLWAGTWLAAAAAAGALWPQRGLPERALPTLQPWTRWAVLAPILTLIATAGLLGPTAPPRYFGAAVVALLPWAGAILSPWFCLALAWPAAALVTQLGQVRANLDPASSPPDLPTVPFSVDARALFESCSTPGATDLRAQAFELARTLPEGATHRVERRSHGREGELVWPLRVLRPDIQIEILDP